MDLNDVSLPTVLLSDFGTCFNSLAPKFARKLCLNVFNM